MATDKRGDVAGKQGFGAGELLRGTAITVLQRFFGAALSTVSKYRTTRFGKS
jgi:hypothetical protein